MNNDAFREVPNEEQRKLLDSAKKAAGLDFKWGTDGFSWYGKLQAWNPLTNYGDALDLAARVGMTFEVGSNSVRVRLGEYEYFTDKPEPDRYTELCFGIVTVAANIGKDAA